MISLATIQTLAQKYQTTELNVRREYVQHIFLSYFYRLPQTAIMLFKGGTALRIIYGSPRFSEDLDFNTTTNNITTIESCILNTLDSTEREGIPTKIIESKKTSGGYLAILHFLLNHHTVALQIEISFREKNKRGELATIAGDLIPPYTLFQLSQNQLIEEKVRALLSRGKPRDYYDIYFILRANLLPAADKHIVPRVHRALQESRINFEQELKQFLPKSHWPLIKNFKVTLTRELNRYV